MMQTTTYKDEAVIQSWPKFLEQNKLKFLIHEFKMCELHLTTFKLHEDVEGNYPYKYVTLLFLRQGEAFTVEIGEGEQAEMCDDCDRLRSIPNYDNREILKYNQVFTDFSEYLNQTFQLNMEND